MLNAIIAAIITIIYYCVHNLPYDDLFIVYLLITIILQTDELKDDLKNLQNQKR